MEISDLMNINELSMNFDPQVKYFYIHCWETSHNSVTSNIFYEIVKQIYIYTANKLTAVTGVTSI